MLRPLDIIVLLKIRLIAPEPIGQIRIAKLLHISSASVNGAIRRGTQSRLYDPHRNAVNIGAMEEVLFHGIRYFMPPEQGAITRGVPTAWAAPPLSGLLAATNEPPPVWPDPDGDVRGQAFLPLHECALKTIHEDRELYEVLALVDAIRIGRARESQIAEKELRGRLNSR